MYAIKSNKLTYDFEYLLWLVWQIWRDDSNHLQVSFCSADAVLVHWWWIQTYLTKTWGFSWCPLCHHWRHRWLWSWHHDIARSSFLIVKVSASRCNLHAFDLKGSLVVSQETLKPCHFWWCEMFSDAKMLVINMSINHQDSDYLTPIGSEVPPVVLLLWKVSTEKAVPSGNDSGL